MTELFLLLILACCATAHIVMASVLALYARYKVQYLSLAWIVGIFGVYITAITPFYTYFNQDPGIAHPIMLGTLTAFCFLQSIYPLSIPMPAYLQWERMWAYASPAIFMYAAYGIAAIFGHRPLNLYSFSELGSNWMNIDILFRIIALLLAIYYVVNILRLPKHLVHNTEVPRYIKGYCSALSLSVILYLVVTIWYSPQLMMVYVVTFTLLNLYLGFRTLETMAMSLPKPVIEKVEKEPEPEVIEQAEKEDFNEANRQRFQRIEYWMQNHREEWTSTTFNRDMLCEQVGINRHLILQCVRSQGYNSIHEYLNTYRFEELKRLIQRGQVKMLSESIDAGFGTTKTAKSVFLSMAGIPLDEYIAKYSKKTE